MTRAPKRYAVMLTEAEMVALFTECNCCSLRDDHEAATNRVYGKLQQIGYFRRARAAREAREKRRADFLAKKAARVSDVLTSPLPVAEKNRLLKEERA